MTPDLDMKDRQTMRVALISLIALGAAIGTSAIAQDAPATMPMPMPAEPAAPAPAPDAAAAAPAADAPPAAPETPPPPPPRTPTDVTSLAVLNVLQNVCLPLAKGADLAGLVKPMGFKLKRDLWVQQYLKGGYTITVHPVGSNPGVCNVDIDHPIDGITEVIIDLHNWAMARDWTLYRNDKYDTGLERTTRSWTLDTAASQEALVLLTVRKPGGKPMTAKTDHTELLYSFKALAPAT